MIIQNGFLQLIAGTILSIKNDQPIGLLSEVMNMRLRHRLQDIRKECVFYLEKYVEEQKEIEKSFEGKTSPDELKEKKQKLEDLAQIKIQFKAKPALMSDLEQIVTQVNYSFDILKLIAT